MDQIHWLLFGFATIWMMAEVLCSFFFFFLLYDSIELVMNSPPHLNQIRDTKHSVYSMFSSCKWKWRKNKRRWKNKERNYYYDAWCVERKSNGQQATGIVLYTNGFTEIVVITAKKTSIPYFGLNKYKHYSVHEKKYIITKHSLFFLSSSLFLSLCSCLRVFVNLLNWKVALVVRSFEFIRLLFIRSWWLFYFHFLLLCNHCVYC